MAQQAVHANMAVGNSMPMAIPLNQLNPQQLRQTGRMGPGQHPQTQAIMAQQLAQQQQQQAAQHQQMPGGPGQAQHMPMNAQSMANMQQQAQMAGAGAQNQMGGQQQGGQQAQGQPQPQPQAQPQQPGQKAQHTPQQASQAGTPAPSGQQTPSQTPAQQGPMQQGQGQGQPQQVHAHAQAQHHMNAAAAQQLAMTSSLFQQQRREGMKGQCLLKFMQFSEHLSAFPGSKGKDDLSYWNAFVARYFSPIGVFRTSLHISDAEDTTDKQYEIGYPALARYFHTHFSSGVRNMQLIMDKGVTDRQLSSDCHCIENGRASLLYWFETGSHLVATGTLRAQFDADQRMELFEFLMTDHEEFISRKRVIDAAKPAHNWFKEWRKANVQDVKQSPEMSKKSKGKQLKLPQTQPPEVLMDLPDSAVNSKGLTEAVHQFLEIVEVMGQMNPLFGFCHCNPGVAPYAALEQYVSTTINGGPPPPMNVNGQPMPQESRTPSFGQFTMGASPAAAHMNLPGSPLVSSPAPGHMQAPGMQLQPSQQGTSSSGPSANTSPASKRRRPSGVKGEDGSGAPTPAGPGPQVNGIQNRANKPPTPRMPKRVKGNAS